MVDETLSLDERRKAFVEELARIPVPGDGAEEAMRGGEIRFFAFEFDSFDEAVMDDAGDDFQCSQVQTLWDMVRKARELL